MGWLKGIDKKMKKGFPNVLIEYQNFGMKEGHNDDSQRIQTRYR